jgi:hypothetical protein
MVTLVVLALVATLAARPAAAGGGRADGPSLPRSLRAVELTPDFHDRYRFAAGAGRVRVAAPSANVGGNLRMAFWDRTARASVDQQSCVTWTSFGGAAAQGGVALRVRGSGRDIQALTVTNNIWFGARNGWNVHLWQLAFATFRTLGQVRLTGSFGKVPFQQPPLPWRICARVVGRSFEFKAWSLAREHREPAWGDPEHGATYLLPPGWDRAGRPGAYVGHLHHGEATTFEDLDTRPIRPAGGDLTGLRVRALASSLYPALVGPVSGGVGVWSDTLPPRALTTDPPA